MAISGKGKLIFTAIALGMVGMITGGVALGYALLRPPAATSGGEAEFTIKALITGYIGVGGDIDGMENPDIEVNPGATVKLTLINGEDMTHDIAVENLNVSSPQVALEGDSTSVTFTVPQTAKTYAYYCTLPGHRGAGMEGKLIVGESNGAQPGPAKAVDVAYISRDATDLPSPLNRNYSTTVDIYLEAQEVVAEIEEGTTYTYWTFNGKVPGPFFRVRTGDTVVVHFANAATSTQNHSVDFHAVTGPGGGAVATQTTPGQETTFQFKALNPGLFVYHCATTHIPTHVAHGMYGLILVEPEVGLPTVDKEFYVMQGEFYTKWPAGTEGHQEFNSQKLLLEQPEYVLFNGRYRGLTGDHALRANVGDTIRVYFGVGGTNLASSFHIIGEIFDRVYSQGDLVSAPKQSVQTTLVPPGAAVAVELQLEVPADYILVDHALSRTIDKGALGILHVEGAENPDIYNPSP